MRSTYIGQRRTESNILIYFDQLTLKQGSQWFDLSL